MRIEPLDPADTPRVDAVIDLLAAAHAADFPDDPKFCPGWERGRIAVPSPASREEWWVAVDDTDGVRGVLAVELPKIDNITTALVEITCHPLARRRGIGTALLGHARIRAAEAGRKLLIAESVVGGAAEAFAHENGASVGLADHRQRLVITSDAPQTWDRLLAEAYPHAGGYTTVRWGSHTPDEYVDGMAYLTARMSTDIPLEDLQWGPESWDAERVRAWDRTVVAWDRRGYTTAAVHDASGDVVAYTTLSYPNEDPTHGWQWNTIVEPRHRGHRLGTIIKIENLRFALEHQPETRTVTTWNAESNGPMNAINAALGFRPIDRWAEWQLPIA